jgi:hypothetical protein
MVLLLTILLCVAGLVPGAEAQVTATTPVFGPTTYTRTTGAPNQYTTTFSAPSWIVSPYDLHIVNGDASGTNRVYGAISSATITLNGVQVAGPSDFNQNVATIDRSVTLQATNTLKVTLASKPGSFLTINVFGTSADHTSPQIAIVSPNNGSYINTATPNVGVTYSDPLGTGEPAASGVKTSTFKATLDGVDRTTLFTVRVADASATIPSNLALSAGAHTLIISLQDNAGNSATATSQFTVDLAPPQIQIVQPVLGVYLNTTSPAISIQYSDTAGLNLSTLKVLINGVDDTALFNKTASGATATISLPQGGNQIVAQIQNLAGTQASASTSFNIDTRPPTISFSRPTANSYQGSSTVAVAVEYADDQALDITKLQVTVDGTPVSMTNTATSATGTAANLSNASHTLIATIKDLAGNVGTAQVVFHVDTTVPTIYVSQPAASAIVNTHSPQVSIAYSAIEGVDLSTFKAFVNGADKTTLFSIGPSTATAQLGGAASLLDGQNTITTQISNFAGTVGTATSTFTVDTTPPTISFRAPAARTNSNTPTVTISYSDAGSGVDPFSLTVSVDGADVSSLVAPGAGSATGVLQLNPPLSDGTHQLSATVADRAGNRSQPATLSFVVDTKPPVLNFASPSNNSFIKSPTPSLLLNYNDATGTGVDISTIHIHLQKGTNIPTDITSYFQIGQQQAAGSIPAAASLADATYVLTAVGNDLVGNAGSAIATFVVDTVPPTAIIQAPAANAILNTSLPNVVLQYQDDNSGIDTSKLVVTVDGVDQTTILTLSATQATGTLPALPDGVHTIHLTVFDRAGNSSSVVSQTFTTDTMVPTIALSVLPLPNAAGWNNTSVTVTFTCFDSGSGISTCPPSVAVTTEGASQPFCGQAIDAAGNSSLLACASVNIDKTPPTITASASPAPNAAGWNTSSVTISFACTDTLSGVAACSPPQTVSTPGAGQIVRGAATDVAGNSASTQFTVNISETRPQIIPVIAPPPNAAGWNNTNVTVSFTCTPGGAPITSCPLPQLISTEGASIPVGGTVTDAAGAMATTSVVIKLDKTPPTVIPSISPAPNSSGWESSPVTVSFTCSDSLSGVATCPSPASISNDGANQPVSGTATDVAGNTATASANVNLEQALPTISASASPAANSAGWNNTAVTVNFTCHQSVSPIASCSPAQTVSTQGVGQVITGTVQDQAGHQSTTSVTLNITETSPTILQFTAPAQLSPGQSGSATITVSDIASIASVVFQLNGATIGTALSPPYTANVTAPGTATSGSTLTLTAVVTDIAGNATSANKGIQVVSSGVIVGQVLSDTTGLPLGGASLQVVGQAGEGATADSLGRYSIPVTSNQLFLSVSQPGNSGGTPAMVTVERQVSVQSGVGTVPVDARMTAIAVPTTITASGGTVGAGAITVTVPAGGATTSFYLTPLSPQGLPGLLPLGWSPVAAFDLRTNISNSASLSANFTGLPSGTLYLVTYSYNVHAWNMVMPNLSASNGSLTAILPSVGDYALVVPDAGNPNIQIPATGQPLTGVPMVALPTTATSSGSLSPANIAPTGGTSIASLAVQSTTPLPSGTVIQSEVTEKYTLATGQLISEDSRFEDILLYQTPAPSGATVAASFPVTPAQTFQVSQLSSGDVHMDILSGRESVRGQTGGSDPVAVQSGDATLTVAAGSLAQDTAIAVNSEPIDTFLPSTSTLVPLSEYSVDFSGQVLNAAAQLSVGAGIATPGSNVVIAQIQRVGGVPFLVVVSMAQVTATNIVSQVTPGLPGITQGGDYVFYELTVPTGFVSGTVSASSGPVAATVQTDALPFVAFSNSNGNYAIVAAAGTVHLTASIPNTALAGTATAQVTAGQTASANLIVAGQVESATITPANGAVGVPLTAEIDVTAADAFNPATVTSSDVLLTAAGSSTHVAVRFVFSAGGTKLAIFPQVALHPSTQYTLQTSGLATAVGGLISVPTISFTTVAITPPTYNTNALVFAMPDANGNVQISAPANSFPAGSTILIVDQTNGVVYSLTVFNDGSVTGQMPATINDLLQITFTDPAGNITSFTRSQFVAADGTVAVGPGGGTVTGPGGTALIIPPGALNQGATFKLAQFDQSALPDLPAVDNLQFGTGLTVQTSGVQQFNKEVKLVFPVPSGAPSGAQYYVYRRVTFADGTIGYEVIDEALLQGSGSSAQVVTASPPFYGYQVVSSAISTVINGIDTFLCAYTFDPVFPTQFTQGAITGKVLGSSYQKGSSAAVTTGIQGAQVRTQKPGVVDSATRKSVFAVSQADGTYTLWDPNFTGGTVTATASNIPASFLPPGATSTTTYQTTAFEIHNTDTSPFIVLLSGLLGKYVNVAYGDIIVPPPAPPQPPPAFQISVMQVNNGIRTSTSGIVTAGASLIVGVNPQPGSGQGVGVIGTTIMVNGQSLSVGTDNQGQFAVMSLYTPPLPAVYTVQVTVANAFGGPPTIASYTFRAVGSGGSGSTTTPGQAPEILTGQSYPTNGATQVPVDVNPLITFSEPVTIPAGSVHLQGSAGNVIPSLIGGVDNHGNPYSDITKAPAGTAFTSITIQPLQGLRYSGSANDPNGMYQIVLSQAIQDLNHPPLSLVAGSSPIIFYTYEIPVLSFGAAAFASPGIFVAKDRAYVAEITAGLSYGFVWQYNVSNPSDPFAIPPASDGVIEGRADYVTGQDNSTEAGGQTLVAVAVAPYPLAPDQPGQTSHVMLYKGTSSAANSGQPDSLSWIGAVSLTSGATDGVVSSIAVQDNRLYAATIRKGIQVVDLDQVISEFPGSSRATINYDINTAGQGFANDAVIATIGVQTDPTLEYLDDLLDIKVANYPAPGGQNQTLAVATGSVPSAPGSSTGVSFVVADPNAVTILSKSTPQSAAGTLNRGVALALGSIQTAAAVQNIAAVVGAGTMAGCSPSSCSVLAVIDMTTPSQPQPLSFTVLAGTPVSVVLKGNTTIVGYNFDVSDMYDLTNPASPLYLGSIAGVGGSMFLYNGDILFSTGAVPGVPTSSLGGVHAAVLDPVVLVEPLPPIFAASAASSDSYLPPSQQSFQLATDLMLKVDLLPPNPAIKTGNLLITYSNGSTLPPIPLTFDSTGSFAMAKLPANTFITGTTFTAMPSVNNPPTGLLPIPSGYTVGTAAMLLDLDNNTRLDPQKDRLKLNTSLPKDVKFGFWEADPTITGTQESLTDFAQIQLKIDALPTLTQGKLYLQLQGNLATPSWVLTTNVGVPANADPTTLASGQKMYLSDSTLNGIPSQELPLTSGAAVDCSSAGGTNSPATSLCQSDGTGSIELTNLVNKLGPGTYTLLLSCNACKTDPTRAFQLAVVGGAATAAVFPSAGLAPPGIVEKQFVDIRPIHDWVSVFSARESDPPPATATAPADSTWSNTVPQGGNVTVLVHGYSVSEDEALTQSATTGQAAFVPALTKRMYWAAFPMLATQMVPLQTGGKVPAYTVAFLWKGDYVSPNIPLIGSYVNPLVAPLFFSDDSFRALESGTPLAGVFNQLNSNGNQIQVIAHSMGNIAVNSALTQVSANTVQNYVMNEAAVPAEAFFQDGGLLATANSSAVAATNPFLFGFLQTAMTQNFPQLHLSQMGQTDNSVWTQLLSQVLASPTTKINGAGAEVTDPSSPLVIYEQFYGDQNPTPTDAAAIDYTQRWQFQSGLNYGPWLGYFAANLGKTNIFNSFNNADCVLDNAYLIKQLVQSPDRSFGVLIPQTFGDSIDDLNNAFANPTNPFPIANLSDNLTNQQWLYQPPSSPSLYGNQANYRRWSRLAYWYSATSLGVGAYDFGAFIQGSSPMVGIPMTGYVGSAAGLTDKSGAPLANSTCFQMPAYIPTTLLGFKSSQVAAALQSHLETHGYLRAIPLPSIWKGYKGIRAKLYPSIPDPDDGH